MSWNWPEILAVALFLLLVAILLRRGAVRLVGPVFVYDLVRTARRGKAFLLRSIYAAVFLVVLFLFYSSHFTAGGLDMVFMANRVSPDEMARFAESFFQTFLAVQFAAIFILTPIYAAGALGDEKERRTLDFLLATDLRNREIILGLLASRLVYLCLILLVGLPILGLMQFLGGVDPNLVLAGFAISGIYMVSVAGVSIMNSVRTRRRKEAIIQTYFQILLFILASICCGPLSWATSQPDIALLAGNPVLCLELLFRHSRTVGTNPLMLVVGVAFVHAPIALITVDWAILKLRKHAARDGCPHVVTEVLILRLPDGSTRHISRSPALELPRPFVRDRPVLWREVYVEKFFRFNPINPVIELLVAAIGLTSVLVALIVLYIGIVTGIASEEVTSFANSWVRVLGTPAACFMLLSIAIRASMTMSGERDRQTLEGLLTTPLGNRTILGEKWLGSILSVRSFWWGLGPVWGLGILATGIGILALPVLLLAWCAYAAFFAALGLWCSLVSKSTLRATVWTLLMAVGVHASGFLFRLVYDAFGLGVPSSWLEAFADRGLAPAVTLWTLTFCERDFADPAGWDRLTASLAGVGCYAAAAAVFWWLACSRFARVTGRMPVK